MDITLNKKARQVVGIDREALDKRGTTTGFIELEVTENNETRTLSTENVIFVNENRMVLQGHFGVGDGVPGVLIMLMKPLVVGAYSLGNPMAGNPDGIAIFGEVYEGNVVGGTYGDGQLTVIEASSTKRETTLKGSFHFEYTLDGKHVFVVSRQFEVKYVLNH
jgi:hypothetical protein